MGTWFGRQRRLEHRYVGLNRRRGFDARKFGVQVGPRGLGGNMRTNHNPVADTNNIRMLTDPEVCPNSR